MVGGSVKGGQVLGKYPTALHEESDVNVGNGVLLPTTPWEAIWGSIAEWLDVDASLMDEVVPNAKNFPQGDLFTAAQMFE
mgnify:CR=1 FL=1